MAADRIAALNAHLRAQPTAAAPSATIDAKPQRPDDRQLATTSPYLLGNFGPVSRELHAEALPVLSGRIPRDVDGQFVRNGPNPQFDFANKPYFWFDGDGMLHAIRIHNGQASYINRFVRTARYESDAAQGESCAELGELGVGNLAILNTSDKDGERMGKANTALAFYNRRVLALEEADKPYIIKLPELETIGRYTFNKQLTHPVTAHPLIDAKTNEMMLFGYDIRPSPPYVHYSYTDAMGKIVRTVPIAIREDAPIMMHSFAITEHYSILMDLPLRFIFANMGEGKEPWEYHDVGSRFGILPRHATSTEQVKWFNAETCMIFHTANAWEEGDEVVLIACRARHFQLDGLYVSPEDAKKDTRVLMHEYRFDMRTGETKERCLNKEHNIEFPVIHVPLTGYKCRYVYAARFVAASKLPLIDGVLKFDLQTGQVLVHDHRGLLGGECVFVPRDNATSEDDGYLVTFLFDEKTNSSHFVMINAKTMDAEPVCRIATPHRVPYGFHGMWFTQKQIDAQALAL